MSYTYATAVIAAADQAAAQADLGEGFFNAGYSATGEAPATHFISSGPFENAELNLIVNAAAWPKQIYFGNDLDAVLAELGLQMVNEGGAE